MLTNLIRNIQGLLPMEAEEQGYFLSLFESRSVKKGTVFLKEKHLCDYVAYINKGLVRYYRNNGDREYTGRIFMEDEWVSDYAAFLTRGPAMICLEALETTELITLSYSAVQKAYDKAKVFERFGRLMAEKLFLENVDHSVELLQKSPEERYLDMVRLQPEILCRVPLKYIASMLGIEPESLSRIRKRMAAQ